MSADQPMVSVAIPAYNIRFFEAALSSALAQDCDDFEVLVCDDSEGSAIEAVCRRLACDRLRYLRNPRHLGFTANFTHCFEQARGRYLKLLNDDDVLAPGCVRTMAEVFERRGPEVKLVTSKRQLIDEHGRFLPDIAVTAPLSAVSVQMKGIALGDLVLTNAANVIGEPSTVMFRRADVSLEEGELFRFFGHDYIILADLCLWLRLLSKGDAVYLVEPLSRTRAHGGQESEKRCHLLRQLTEWVYLFEGAARIGFLSGGAELPGLVRRRANAIRSLLDDPQLAVRIGWDPDDIGAARPQLEGQLHEWEQRYGQERHSVSLVQRILA
jgi:glycosyltransferase involved in cell wall biosynthesis